ncbi:MAG: acyltransferase [Chitinophagaceae bacterium]|nr:acyltransferase [Chitinophagaceae bacterium]
MANNGYIRSLDGLRAIAILLVMSYHGELDHYGWTGVQLFFVLSGFLITGILWNERSRPGSNSFKFKKFWVRRALRIFPLYFGYVGIIGLSYLFFRFPVYYPSYFPYLITYTVNYIPLFPGWYGNPLFTHLWSLSIEEQFYLIFPFIILLGRKGVIRTLLLSIIALGPLARFLLGEYFKTKMSDTTLVAHLVDMHTLSHLDAFCFGGIIPVLSLDTRLKHPATILGSATILLVSIGLLNFLNTPTPYNFWQDGGFNNWYINNYQHVWIYSLFNLFSASLILFLVSKHSASKLPLLRKIFESRWMVSIGRISYGMYVFHWLILVYVIPHLFDMGTYWMKLVTFIPYVAAVYGFSALSYRLYESRFIRMKDRLFKSPDTDKKRSSSDTAIVREGSAGRING